MKTVLMLAYYFYPYNSIATQRTAKMAKYLPEYGWNPMIVCPKWIKENCPNFDTEMVAEFEKSNVVKSISMYEHSPKRFSFRWFFYKISNPRLSLTWRLLKMNRSVEKLQPEFYYDATTFLKNYLRSHRIDCVWATCPGPTPHTIASWIYKKFGIPWVADFRDVSDQKFFEVWWGNERRANLIKVEPRILSSSSAIVTVSEPLKEILQRRNKTPVYVIPNGFDPDDYGSVMQTKQKIFNIVYTGNIIPGRNPTLLFEGLEKLIHTKKVKPSEVSACFYGSQANIIKNLLGKFKNLNNIVQVYPRISFSESVITQKQACILLHLAHSGEKGIYTGKIFEYLGAQRPILCIPGDNDCVDALLKQTRAGIVCRNAEETAAQLLLWYKEWQQTGRVVYYGRKEEIMKYSRKVQARELAKLLNQSINGSCR